ncbi:uncharacterized protein UV8b_03264 [Ustilaginoidea virens]|uniref:Uncharacterized protein n=1 Tax=Ustilaginoidea virens TaxID=1159556 RepID=A0A8E5MG08_USTVR|nr:uncharacterized protein UV8b_03264 [Ustilaginoidea virens]QUC19023.1 hypothetical protein UV8b_03264 [Ustilaginoidea virens]
MLDLDQDQQDQQPICQSKPQSPPPPGVAGPRPPPVAFPSGVLSSPVNLGQNHPHQASRTLLSYRQLRDALIEPLSDSNLLFPWYRSRSRARPKDPSYPSPLPPRPAWGIPGKKEIVMTACGKIRRLSGRMLELRGLFDSVPSPPGKHAIRKLDDAPDPPLPPPLPSSPLPSKSALPHPIARGIRP